MYLDTYDVLIQPHFYYLCFAVHNFEKNILSSQSYNVEVWCQLNE